jgi:hypothetical protein
MGLLNPTFNMFNHWRPLIEHDMEEREGELIQQVEMLSEVPRGFARLAENGAWMSRADRGCEVQETRKEKEEVIKTLPRGLLRLAAWIFIFLIIWTQLFHCK